MFNGYCAASWKFQKLFSDQIAIFRTDPCICFYDLETSLQLCHGTELLSEGTVVLNLGIPTP